MLSRRPLALCWNLRLGDRDQTPCEFAHLLKRRRVWLPAGLRHRRLFLRPRSSWRPLLASRRCEAQVCASQVAVGEAAVHDGAHHIYEAASVIEPMDLFVKVRGDVERVNADVGALDGALQERPEVFKTVGVDLPLDIAMGVVHDLMLIHFLQALVGPEGVSKERRPQLHLLADLLLQILFANAAHDRCRNARLLLSLAALQHPEHGNLVHAASPTHNALLLAEVHEPRRATEEAFVRLYVTAHLAEGAALHGQANPMEHEPCSFLCDFEATRQFVGADAVLAVGQHPDRGHPLVESERAILEDRPQLRGELPPAVPALVDAPSLEEHWVLRIAGGTEHAMRPAQADKESVAHVGVREVANSRAETVGEVRGLGHAGKLRQEAWCVKYVIALTSA